MQQSYANTNLKNELSKYADNISHDAFTSAIDEYSSVYTIKRSLYQINIVNETIIPNKYQ